MSLRKPFVDNILSLGGHRSYRQRVHDITIDTPCFSVFDGFVPLMCFGFLLLWQGVAEAWAIADSRIFSMGRAISAVRAGKRIIENVGPHMDLRRLQMAADLADEKAQAVAPLWGFNREAVLREYGPSGNDYMLWVRFYHGSTLFKAENSDGAVSATTSGAEASGGPFKAARTTISA